MAQQVRFAPRTPFDRELRQAVDAWFAEAGRSRTGGPRLWLKALVFVGGWLATVVAFWTLPISGWLIAPLAVFSGIFMAGIGMSVQHDANHQASTSSRRVNRLMGLTLDLMGASSYLWATKHNRLHHTCANVSGVDDDLDVGLLARFAPGQQRLGFHRFQHLYMWPLYGFLLLRWYFTDFLDIARRRIFNTPIKPPKGKDLAIFISGKLAFALWAWVLPVILVGFGPTLVFYMVSQFVHGLILAVVFQLAHCVDQAEFVVATPGEVTRIQDDFSTHQLRSTVDFAPRNRLLSFYVGGLNFQAVHHLFPRISHVHYSDLSHIVARVAQAHGVPYRQVPTLRAALASHYRQLKRLGRGEDEAPVASAFGAVGLGGAG